MVLAKRPTACCYFLMGGKPTQEGATTLDNSIAEGVIPSLVAVLVDNPDRGRESSCSSAYADFLAQETRPGASRDEAWLC